MNDIDRLKKFIDSLSKKIEDNKRIEKIRIEKRKKRYPIYPK